MKARKRCKLLSERARYRSGCPSNEREALFKWLLDNCMWA